MTPPYGARHPHRRQNVLKAPRGPETLAMISALLANFLSRVCKEASVEVSVTLATLNSSVL